MFKRRTIFAFFSLLVILENPQAQGASPVTNRLGKEKSPYLLQHADNPVDWYAWGEEAFQRAKREDKPVFLSIGYSTCHWCHVMEEESFENPDVARVMNENFVSIKVDREERPDLDNIYMTAVQAMTGSGGWPLSVFLTPEGRPFLGGTYWPPEDRWGRPGFVSVLQSAAEAWKKNRERILKDSSELVRLIESHSKEKSQASFSLGEETLRSVFQDLQAAFDNEAGGFGSGIKFPRSHTLSFLLRYWKRAGEKEALQMAGKTLSKMYRGGLWDFLGGGFHRYSTDRQWFLPHFEKMLYDQALLARTYLEAYQITGQEEYARTAREIFAYVLRDLRGSEGAAEQSPEGAAEQSPEAQPEGAAEQSPSGAAFYSAEDADSLDPESGRKREGAFYVWKESEILEILGDEKGRIFNFIFGVRTEGNVGSDPHGEFPHRNVLARLKDSDEAARQFKKSSAEIETILETSRRKLFEARAKRPRPHLDDKVLTDWNGLMISSLAFGSRVLEEPRYAKAARGAADFIFEKLVRPDGRLLHRYREGDASIPGTLEDYAFFIHGLVDLYEATFEVRYLAEAKRLTHEMIRLFWDEEAGGFFFTGQDAEKLILRQKEIYDGAIPSGNSLAALDLLRVGRLTMDRALEKKAEALLDSFSESLRQNPEAYPQLLMALDFLLGPSAEIVIAGDPDSDEVRAFLGEINRRFLPNSVRALHPVETPSKSAIEALAPYLKNQLPVGGKPAVYVCKNYVCRFPVTQVSELEKLL